MIALPLLAPAPLPAPPPAPASARRPRAMIDSLGRTIRDLRLSITDRCNFRCVYCMEPDVRFMDSADLLSVHEMVRLAGVAAGLGVEKIRITGGEPALHPRLTDIIRGVAATGVRDVALTTNGSLMEPERLAAWKRAGLGRITVSIDSIHPDRFARITRSRLTPGRVIEGIRNAKAAGFESLKLNAVIVRGLNEDEVAPLAGLARDLGIEMRYIEFMPLDSAHAWDRSRLVPAAEMIDRIQRVYALTPARREDPSSTSLVYDFADGSAGRIGIVAPVTRSFCGACSRLRITADGKVRPCLFSREEWDVRGLLRAGAGDERLGAFLADATWTKQAGHGISSADFKQPDRPMSAIGG